MNALKELWLKLRDKRYREAFVASQVKQAIPYQIRALMKAQELTQAQLAERSGLSQGVISRAASPMYGNLSLNTLVRVAAGFDVAFVGRFVPFSEMTRWLDRLDESAHVQTFEEEDHARVFEGLEPAATVTENMRPSAKREALVGSQQPGKVEALFRLTAPRLTAQAATIHEFRGPRVKVAEHTSAAAMTVVSR